jgi:RNA polymerase sigma-70 factor (sigma-E family)
MRRLGRDDGWGAIMFGESGGAGGHAVGESDLSAEFHAFFEDNYTDLARFAYLLTGDHDAADDVAAEAFTAAWRRWGRVRAADSPLAYVRRTIANMASSRVRKLVRERRGMTALGLLADGGHVDADVPAVIDVRTALLALPARKRACVVLRYAFDLSEDETAKTLGISVGTVKSQTSKAVGELGRLLGRDGNGAAPRRMPDGAPAALMSRHARTSASARTPDGVPAARDRVPVSHPGRTTTRAASAAAASALTATAPGSPFSRRREVDAGRRLRPGEAG